MLMKLQDFKSIFFKPLQHLDEKKLESDLTKEEVYTLFKKIVSGIHANLKDYGFKKQGTNNSYRIIEEIYQSLNFQKSTYNDCFTINICIRPTYWNRPESYYLLSTRRVGNFETGKDKWHEINSDTETTIRHVTEVIKKFVIPIFEKTKSSADIILNQDFLRKEKIYDISVVLFCALRTKNKEIAKNLLDEKIRTLEKDEREAEWVIKDRNYYLDLSKLLESDKWTEIKSLLDLHKVDFYETNKKLKH